MTHNISEDFLHYIWKIKNFNLKHLTSTTGQDIHITNFGVHNHDSGPDFLNASILIDDLAWHGHIEMHIRSSDWIQHNHSQDPAYDSVILHVVLDNDQTILDKNGKPIPTIVLKSRIDPKTFNAYRLLIHKKSPIPCSSWIQHVNDITKSSMIEKVLAERLTQKSEEILTSLKQNSGDWNETIYQRLLWSFGLKVNAEACLRLSSLLPYKILLKHRDDVLLLESLLFGVAGLIPHESNEYIRQLQEHFSFLKTKYNLSQMKAVEWKFMRMRPSGFPTIRVAQFARLINSNKRLDKIIFDQNIPQLQKHFNIKVEDGYWYDHYTFEATSPPKKKTIGQQKLYSILINSVAPLQYAYGIYVQDDSFKKSAIDLLDSIPPESNYIIRDWKKIGLPSTSASHSQGLLHLKKHYCDRHKCLSCRIGHQVFKKIQSA